MDWITAICDRQRAFQRRRGHSYPRSYPDTRELPGISASIGAARRSGTHNLPGAPIERADLSGCRRPISIRVRIRGTSLGRRGWPGRAHGSLQSGRALRRRAREAKVRSLAEADGRSGIATGNFSSTASMPDASVRVGIGNRSPGFAATRALRLREFIDRGCAARPVRLRPVWLMTPDIASRVLQPRPGIFDTVIFDEASQMPVEYALPRFSAARS